MKFMKFYSNKSDYFQIKLFYLELHQQCPKNPGEPSILPVYTDCLQHQAAVPWPDWRTPCGCSCGSRPGGTRATWQWLRPRGGGPVRAAKALDRSQVLSRSGTHLHTKVNAAKVTQKTKDARQQLKQQRPDQIHLNYTSEVQTGEGVTPACLLAKQIRECLVV